MTKWVFKPAGTYVPRLCFGNTELWLTLTPGGMYTIEQVKPEGSRRVYPQVGSERSRLVYHTLFEALSALAAQGYPPIPSKLLEQFLKAISGHTLEM
jgi:hypothetical protein